MVCAIVLLAASPASANEPIHATRLVQEDGRESGLFDAVDRRLRDWSARSPGWEGPRRGAADRFLHSVDAMADRFPASRTTWELLVRGLALTPPPGERDPSSASLARVSDRCGEHLRTILGAEGVGDELRSWIHSAVIARDGGQRPRGERRRERFPTLRQRVVALDLMSQGGSPRLRLPLLMVARRPGDPLRSRALRVLASWAERHGADEAIDSLLVQLLGEPFDRGAAPHPYSLLLERVASESAPLSPRARGRLAKRVRQQLLSSDWRDVTRALALTGGFPVPERVPILLDALGAWDVRARGERSIAGLTRVRAEITQALRGLSGLRHGPDPRPWVDWWISVRQGREPMPGSEAFEEALEEKARVPRTEASFFGLRPETNRVTFVIDASGSMSGDHGTTGVSRYVEAVDQMMRFLHGAPRDTRFSVVLFSGSPEPVTDGFVDASPDSLERVRRRLLAHEPDGGTNLRPAVERALCLGPGGLPDLERAEADTIVVLCDGATAEGASWVAPMLARVLPIHPVKFHGVHIGPSSDGTLARLAERSGGMFIKAGR